MSFVFDVGLLITRLNNSLYECIVGILIKLPISNYSIIEEKFKHCCGEYLYLFKSANHTVCQSNYRLITVVTNIVLDLQETQRKTTCCFKFFTHSVSSVYIIPSLF